jgi:adenylate kinase
MKTILFHGPSGCGKDTQVDLLVKDYGFENIGTGDMFRKMYSQGDIDAIKAHEYLVKGRFVPDDLVYKMLPRWLRQFDKNKNWALVSVVRRVTQIPMFEKVMNEVGRELDHFVHCKLSEEAAIERMSLRWMCPNCDATYHEKYKQESVKGYCDRCGTKLAQREDDRPERIKMRLREYNNTIGPILDYYREKDILVEIDASPTIEEIHADIVEKLNLKMM